MRDTLRVPLLEIESKHLSGEATVTESGSVHAKLDAQPEMWSYNAPLKAWEPVLEACQLQMRYTYNPTASALSGVDPGTTLQITSREPVVLTIAHAPLASMSKALSWYSRMDGQGGDSLMRNAAAADLSVVQTEVHNATGVKLQMWMDFGSRRDAPELPPGMTRLVQPLVQPVLRGNADPTRQPALLLSVRLAILTLPVRLAPPAWLIGVWFCNEDAVLLLYSRLV